MSDSAQTLHLDHVAGAQIALMAAVQLLLTAYKGNQQATAALATELEERRADLLSSSASDQKIQAFEDMAESLLECLS
jgi:tripartite-type tricarboxylate transporter receptor subunit TctC